MTTIHGFRLLKEQDIHEYHIKGRLYAHAKTGAELFSLSNDDENKVFGITFRTPPTDSTGVAHILEHSVLCGSRKYPVKEPFVELLKGSLQTFLNAFTYPDRTCYPVASQNLQDFYNLIDVYLDAVFYPRITRPIFEQEGWHYELNKLEEPLTYKGVVFNEMKGAYSSPDQVLSEYVLESLFPDNPYGFDSGGDPKVIPMLTFEQFQAFHEQYYHPSNARIFFYGDDDPRERLRIMDGWLREFEPREVQSDIRPQPMFQQAKWLARRFMSPEEEEGKSRGMATLNWVLGETREVDTTFALRILEYILLGMPASPLRKTLIDSGLGEDLAGEGLGNELRQTYFSTGLKGIDVGNSEKVEKLILETLEGLVEKGIDPRTVKAAVNTLEFALRENNTGQFPRGLSLMLRAMTTWLYGSDPFAILTFERPLKNIRSQLKNSPGFFESLIKHLLLENQHRVTLILEPDTDLQQKDLAREKRTLEQARSGMGTEDIRKTVENTRELKRLQGLPDSPEALAKIPRLKLDEISKTDKVIPVETSTHAGVKHLFHDLYTNGIVYFDLGMDLHVLPGKYLPYVPLFGRAFIEMGTEKEDFVSLTQRIREKTGGLTSVPFSSVHRDRETAVTWLFLRGKALVARAGDLIDILKDVLLTVRLDNRERFKQMLLEEKAGLEQGIVPGGHRFVNLRLRSHFSEAHWAAEQMGGISYLFFLRKLIQRVEDDWPGVLRTLETMRGILVRRPNMILNVTLDEKNGSKIGPLVTKFLETLPKSPVKREPWARTSLPSFEGMTIPSRINYVGKGTDLYSEGYRFHGSALVISRYLQTGWLWEKVRVQGGAYGAFCMFDRLSGVLSLVSYRDPNVLETLDAFDSMANFLKELKLDDEERIKSIIGAIGGLDGPLLPDAKGHISMIRHLCGDSDGDRQHMREEVLQTSTNHFRDFAGNLEALRRGGMVKVMGSGETIASLNENHPDWLQVVKVL